MPNLTLRLQDLPAKNALSTLLADLEALLAEGLGAPIAACNVMCVVGTHGPHGPSAFVELTYRRNDTRTKATIKLLGQTFLDRIRHDHQGRLEFRAFGLDQGDAISVTSS